MEKFHDFGGLVNHVKTFHQQIPDPASVRSADGDAAFNPERGPLVPVSSRILGKSRMDGVNRSKLFSVSF
jgi:hypothetical protein